MNFGGETTLYVIRNQYPDLLISIFQQSIKLAMYTDKIIISIQHTQYEETVWMKFYDFWRNVYIRQGDLITNIGVGNQN